MDTKDGFKRICTIEPAQLVHDGTVSVNIGDDVTYCEVFIEEHKLGIEQPLDDYTGLEDDEVVLECELSSDSGKFKVMKNGQELTRSGTVKVKRDGKKLKIVINPASKEDTGYYSIETNNGDVSYADVLIEEKPAEITRAFSDLKVNCKDRAEFVCEVSSDDVKGKWFKDGVEIDPEKDDRIKVVSIGKMRKLIIENVCNADQGEYGFQAEGHPACKISAALDTCYATVQKKKEAPKIFLDRSDDKSITVKAGNNLKLDVPLTGSNHKITWRRGPANDEDAELIPMDGKRIWATDGADKERTSFNLNKAEFDDQGPYSCYIEFTDKEENIHKVWNEYMIMVIDVPSPPQKPEIGEVGADTCEINWLPPMDDGGCPFRGYIIERKKVKSSRWIRLNGALCTFHTFMAKRMVEGTKYQVRITAVNEVGSSEPSELSREFIPMAPTAPCSMFKIGKRTDESIELRWLEPEEIGAGGLDKYVLEMMCTKGDALGEWGEAPCGIIKPPSTNIDLTKLKTGATYRFRICTENIAGRSEWIEIGPVICAESVEDAKINIPRAYAAGKRIKVKLGDPIKHIIPFEGKPKPKVTWTKNGEDLRPDDDGKPRFHIRNVNDSTTLFLRHSDRWDSGVYNMKIEVGPQTATADFDVGVIEIPSKPRSFQIADVVGSSAQLKWLAPKDDGNCEILGYQVEKRDAKSDDWFVAVEKVRHTNVQINDLILGNSFYFRVRAMNEVGLGDDAVTKECAVIVKDKMVYKKPDLPPLDFGMKPEFTLGLNDRKIMAGYNGCLTASLKGHPKPKLRWFKGKNEIIDNPKYKTTFSQGIVQLEIRRARPGDAGVYKLIAENSLGAAEIEATIVVKEL